MGFLVNDAFNYVYGRGVVLADGLYLSLVSNPAVSGWNATHAAPCPDCADQTALRAAWIKTQYYATTWLWDKTCRRSEVVGNWMLLHVTDLPKKIIDFITDPRFVITALSVSAIFATQFFYYPVITTMLVKQVAAYVLPYLTPAILNFSECASIVYTAVGFWLRSMARQHNYAH
jgi:hypothetical protein